MDAPIRIAVCDDARAVKMLIRHVLEEDGDMEVVSSTSTGRALLDELGRHRPDALLLDLVLPDVADPCVLVAGVPGASPGTASLPISNLPESTLRQEAGRVGAGAWMLKAERPGRLCGAVRRAVGRGGAGPRRR